MRARLTPQETEKQQGLWWYLLAGVTFLLVAEMVLANRSQVRVASHESRCDMSPMTRNELLDLVRRVRARWRLRVALQGLALVLGLGLLWLVLGA